ncbi:MAG: glycoside hydrolase family 97 protein [Candidatus Azobacteroides sp.]|nr:glycoside hydrolase family 97 protein [Candidatus Azobacteroides sp.]
MKNRKLFLLLFVFFPLFVHAQKFQLASPDKNLVVEISVGDNITYLLKHKQDTVLYPSPISLILEDNVLGHRPVVKKQKTNTVNTEIRAPFYKRSRITDHYNELILAFKGDFEIRFRAYNEGMAYRFVTTGKKDFRVLDEEASFNLGYDSEAFIPYVRSEGSTYEEQFCNGFENIYSKQQVTGWDKKKLAFSPVVINRENGKKIAIAESDLFSYPGMFLCNPDGSVTLKGIFAGYPDKEQQNKYNPVQMLVTERRDYIARCKGNTTFPWRIVIVAENDKELADNDMVYKLATPSRITDIGWIKPGKVAWEWWNNSNLCGVDFKTGVNNQTYKYYIDFASENNIEYVILDDGWTVPRTNDLFNVVPEIDLKELVAYADSRNVGLILWGGYIGFNKDIEGVCRHYSELGIKGFKIDFMERDDQPMVDFHTQVAETAARCKLLIDFHGSYKPTGLQRTYPNVLNFEAVHGLEQLKFPTDADQVEYDVTFPFIRQIAGPVDYTQGAMRNASKENFRPVYGEPMSQGTRCRQLATYIVFESPLNMLCDSPSNYEREKECTAFIAGIPTVWDNTIALDGKIGEYIAIARQKGDCWYVGAMTDWNARTVELDLSFLGAGNYVAEIFRDGVNADKAASDYKKETIPLRADKKIQATMASGGGYAMRIIPVK